MSFAEADVMTHGPQEESLRALQSILISPQIESRLTQLEGVVARLIERLDEGKPFEQNVVAAVKPQIDKIESERLSRGELARCLVEIARGLE